MAELASFVPEIWSAKILNTLLDILVAERITNTDYEGEIKEYGDTVKINEIGSVTINSYTPGTTSDLTIQKLADAQKELRIDQGNSFSFRVGDVAKVQTKPKVMAEAMRKATHGLAKTIDTAFAGLYTECALVAGGSRAGAAITGVDITSTNILKYISLMAQKLDEADVPYGTRWAFVPPWFYQKMALAKIVLATDNKATIESGALGNFYGFDFYMSNNVTNGTPAADDACVMFGYRDSISLAKQLVTVETARPAKSFYDIVKGLMLFGIKVVRPNQTGVLYADYTAEST